MSDKIITAVSRTADGIEWTTRQIGDKEKETHDHLPVKYPGGRLEEEMASITLPEGLHEKLRGEVVVSLRSSDLLLHVTHFPTNDAEELSGMAQFQVDKLSPFPADQLAISHEVLHSTEQGATVLMAAARRSCIDAIGDRFEKAKIRIHSIDARILGWLKLLKDEQKLTNTGCEVVILDDGLDFNLIILNNGIPELFRMLHQIEEDKEMAEELAHELEYALTSLGTKQAIEPPAAITYWCSEREASSNMLAELANLTGVRIAFNNLNQLPPLSTGIIRRATDQTDHRIELIPLEWLEHVKRKRMLKKAFIITGAIAAVWLLLLGSFTTLFFIRKAELTNVQEQAAAITPAANKAMETRRKLEALKAYINPTYSALECLREATALLPRQDIEFTSFKFTKNKALYLGGSAANSTITTEYFDKLTESDIFQGIKNQSSRANIRRGVRREIYSVNLLLPEEQEEEK